MKLPKKTKRYCPKCRKSTEHSIEMYKSGTKRGSLSKGSIQRAKKRGLGRGVGNKGKWGSKPAVGKFKRTGAKSSKKTTTKYTCGACKKSTQQKKGKRAKKMEFE